MSKKIFTNFSIIKDAKKGKMFILVDDKTEKMKVILLYLVQNVIQK